MRYPGDDRWRLAIDSAKVRATVALAERVRLGVHPYEALGLEVEKVAGDWDTVRILRRELPAGARSAGSPGVRRRGGAARGPGGHAGRPGWRPTWPDRLAPLDEVLDTYADLLVADGVHALVTGRADLANAAMEAAAGLGAPPELRAIRTPRGGHDGARLRMGTCCAAGGGGARQRARRRGRSRLRARPSPAGADHVGDAAAERLAGVLGGGEDDPPVPSLTGRLV